MLELLGAESTDSDFCSDELFLLVQKREKHTQTCKTRISEKHPCPIWGMLKQLVWYPQVNRHLRHSCYLTKLSYCLLCLISIRWNPWSIWVFLSASTLFIITSCNLLFQNVLPNFPADSKWFLVFSTPQFP